MFTEEDFNLACFVCGKELPDWCLFCSDKCENKYIEDMEAQGSGPSSVGFDEEDDIP